MMFKSLIVLECHSEGECHGFTTHHKPNLMKHYFVKKISLATWCAVALGLTVASSFAQSVISMNFDGQSGTGTPGAVTGVAG